MREPREPRGTLRPMTDVGIAAQLRPAFELSPTVLAVSSLEDGRLLDVNEAFVKSTGWSREEVIGRPIPELGLWVDPEVRQAGLNALRAGAPVRDLEVRLRTKAGDVRVAIANADLVVLDGRPCVISALIDITERVRAETAMRESEQRFADLFNANPVPMTIVRMSDGRTLAVNDAMLRVSGYARDDVIGRTTPELGFWAVPEERRRLVELLERDQRVRDFEMLFRTKQGEHRHFLVNADVLTYAGGPAVLNVGLDITERNVLEQQREVRREEVEMLSRAKDEFLAMLGHELRNPLGTITNTLAVMKNGGGDVDLARLMAVIARQTTHLTRLVDDLLDVARVTSGKIELRPELVDLRALAHQCVDALAEAGRTATHRVALEGPALRVEGDPARLAQVIANLLDNALKYTPAGGEVRVVTAREGDQAVLRVRDSGEGIRTDLVGRVFDLFVQEPQALDRSRGGLGLGLTLVKRLVELHGGTVSAWSDGPGRGSEFSIRLPVQLGQAVAGSAVPPPAAAPGDARRRVLVVEDNDDAREMMQMLLECAGHEVATAVDGPAGLAQLERFQPDVAVIDIGLPGIDGYEVARKVRAIPRSRGLRLIAVTGYGQAEDRRKALDAGFDLHITKPVDPDRLVQLLAAG
jgi:PAS domain S-box-containing protein